MRTQARKWTSALGLFTAFALFMVVGPLAGNASAETLLPQGGGGTSKFLEISVQSMPSPGAWNLEAPYGFYKFYSSDQNFDISIYDGCMGSSNDYPAGKCFGKGGFDTPSGGGPAGGRSIFRSFALDSNGNRIGATFQDRNSDGLAEKNWSHFTLTFPDAQVSSRTGKYEIEMQVFFRGYSGFEARPQANAFQLSSRNGDTLGVAECTSVRGCLPFAVQNRPAFGVDDNWSFQFAPNCDTADGQSITLEWSDADGVSGSSSPYDPNIKFYLVDDTTGTRVNLGGQTVVSETSTPVNIGGNNQHKSINFNVTRGHKYTWHWENVLSNNGIQYYMPFDSNNYTISCPPPPPVATEVQANVFKVDSVGNYIGQVIGVTLRTCMGTAQRRNTPDNGFVFFDATIGSGYCVGINGTSENGGSSALAGYDGPFIRPWDIIGGEAVSTDHYDSQDASKGYFPSCGASYNGSNLHHHCDQPAYESQVAGRNDGWRNTWGSEWVLDRGTDRGFDFVYVRKPIASVSCNSTGFSDREVGDPFGPMSVGYTVNNNATVDSSYTMTVSYNSTAVPGVKFTPASAKGPGVTIGYDVRGSPPNIPATPPIGTYAVEWNLSGPTGFTPVPCSKTFKVTAKPYFKVYGNDVRVGMDDATHCKGWVDRPTAGVKAIMNPALSAGAGSQLGVTALGKVLTFASSSMRSPGVPYQLTLANSSPPRNGGLPILFGGEFGDTHCALDYFESSKDLPVETVATLGAGDLSGANRNRLINRGGLPPLVIDVGAVGKLSGRRVIFVDGDVMIRSNLNYSSYSWANGDAIPYFYLVVRGNIYVSSNVRSLDGVYIAQPVINPSDRNAYTKGTIYTCADGGNLTTPLFTADTLYNNCNNQLKVWGSLIAEQVKFLRVLNTVGQSTSGEGPDTGKPAEEIQFSSELYLTPSPFDDGEGQHGTTNDAITSLPPVF